jgi:RNA polymerase sigma factor (sigma-70 family)
VQRRTAILSDNVSREDRAAFERLYGDHRIAVRRHLLYLTGNRATAEDLTQDTFGRLYERLLSDDSTQLRNPRAWLLTVASHLAYNYFRAESRRSSREGEAGSIAHQDADVDDVLDVRRALGELDERDRIVLMLRHSGFSYAEVAEAVDIAPSSVGTILARAQRRFREAYEGARPGVDEKE